jgi:hypothetical protein
MISVHDSHSERKPQRTHPTDEFERRQHINSVVTEIRGETRTSHGFEAERIEDLRASKIEQIDQLMSVLEEEGVDCSGIEKITPMTPISEVNSVLHILRRRNDQNRYTSIADEVILGFADLLGTVFDGTRRIPGTNFAPDYTNYQNTVNVKLHRMKFETAQVVGGVVERFAFGPVLSIGAELLPSLILYPGQRKAQTTYSDTSQNAGKVAMSKINDADKKQSLNDAENL